MIPFLIILPYRSVGCTVIELLEGRPPYHALKPMQALYRIVQDDCPPIPEGASPIVKDFLYHCFQKDCNLRISAKKLLRHPWMLSAKKQMADGKRKNGEMEGSRPLSNYNFDEAVLKVQEWNEALRCKSCCIFWCHQITNITRLAHSSLAALKTWRARPLRCRSAAGGTCLAGQSTLQRVFFACSPLFLVESVSRLVCLEEGGLLCGCEECCTPCTTSAGCPTTA